MTEPASLTNPKSFLARNELAASIFAGGVEYRRLRLFQRLAGLYKFFLAFRFEIINKPRRELTELKQKSGLVFCHTFER
jgi:hypothetical protein